MDLRAETRVSPHPDVVWRLVEGEVVLLNVSSGQYYSLDEVGSRVWGLVPPDGITVGALRDALLAEYDATPEEIESGLLSFFARLADVQLVATA